MELTNDICLRITQQSISVMQNWGMTEKEAVTLAGLEGLVKARHLDQYLNEQAFPNEKDIYLRLEHILGIDEALATTYPRNNQMAKMWLNRPHRRFAKRTPLAMMLEEGAKGLVSVRMDLDCTFGRDINNI